MKNPLEAWLRSRGSGIWWSHSFEKIGASEITGCHLDNLVSLKGHCDLFFVCEVGITNHLNNETPCGPHQYPPLIRKGAFLMRPHVGPINIHHWSGRGHFPHRRFPLQSSDFSFALLFICFLTAILDSPFFLLLLPNSTIRSTRYLNTHC